MAETTSAPSLRDALDTRVDANVWTAAQILGDERLAQPEWLWFDEARTSFGRWSRNPRQAPYVRADIAIASVAKAVAAARAEGRKEVLSELAAKADEQLDYWRRRMGDEKTMEDGVSEDGSNYTPIGDEAAWSGGYCNGRLSGADWWGWTIRALIPAPPTTPGGRTDG